MKSFFFKTFLLIILLNSCANKPQVFVIQSFEFKTGMINVSFQHVGLYEQDGTEYLYFVDKYKDIKIFDFDGKLFDNIPLKNLIYDFAVKKDKICGGVQFVGNDSVVIHSSYRNNIGLINRKGDILQIVCIDSILHDSIKNLNEYHFSHAPNAANWQNDFLFSVRTGDKQIRNKGLKPLTVEYYEDYYTTLYNTPYLLKINKFFSDKPEYNFLANDLYKKINSYPYVDNGLNPFKVINNNIFILSREKPLIFKYFGKNYEKIEKIKVISKYTDLDYMPVSPKEVFCDFTTNQNNYEKYNENNKLRGQVFNIFFNEKEQKYYVFVWHKQKNMEEYNKNGKNYSIITYNRNFKKLKEYLINTDLYAFGKAVMTSKGLLIQRKEQNLTPDNYGTQIFDLLGFN
ncbi:MAG: hypothetical protein LBB53_02100 [Prevotellaceae bacterium]|jgi:hypothetical protein|nr:hypothetical protein [Prevotellaceae bacterium]